MSIILIEDLREAALQIGHVLLSQGEGTSLTRYGVLDAGAMVHPDTSYLQSKDVLKRQDGHEFGASVPSLVEYPVRKTLDPRLGPVDYLKYA